MRSDLPPPSSVTVGSFMNFAQEIAIIAGVCLLVGYPILMRVFAQGLQSSRLRMLEIGKELLAHQAVPEEHKNLINSMLDDAYNPAIMILISMVMPYYIIKNISHRTHSPPPIEDKDAQRLHGEFCRRFVTAIAAANPAFTLVAALEMALLAMALFPFGQLWRTQDVQFGTIQVVDRTIQAVGRVLHRGAT